MTQFTCKGVKQINNRISLNMTFTFTIRISLRFSSAQEFQMGNFQKYWSQSVGQDFIVLDFFHVRKILKVDGRDGRDPQNLDKNAPAGRFTCMLHIQVHVLHTVRGHHGRDCMVNGFIFTKCIYNECKSNQNYILNCSPFPPFSDMSHTFGHGVEGGGGAIQDLILIKLKQCWSTLKLKVSVKGRRLMAMDCIPPPTLPFLIKFLDLQSSAI